MKMKSMNKTQSQMKKKINTGRIVAGPYHGNTGGKRGDALLFIGCMASCPNYDRFSMRSRQFGNSLRGVGEAEIDDCVAICGIRGRIITEIDREDWSVGGELMSDR